MAQLAWEKRLCCCCCKLNCGVLRLEYIKSCSQLAECFAKGLGPKDNESICNKMGMINIFSPS